MNLPGFEEEGVEGNCCGVEEEIELDWIVGERDWGLELLKMEWNGSE